MKSACTLQTSKYWIIKCRASGGGGGLQLPAFSLSMERTHPHVPGLFKTEPVARRVGPKLLVCAGTRAPSQLIACDSSQSRGPLKHHNLVVLAYERSNMPAGGGEEGKHSIVITDAEMQVSWHSLTQLKTQCRSTSGADLSTVNATVDLRSRWCQRKIRWTKLLMMRV